VNKSTLDEQLSPRLARGVRLQTDPQNGEPILLFPEGVLYLSQTANEILIRCDGHNTIAGLISKLVEEYEADSETLRKDVLDCLLDLQQRKLVVL
jgi:pyrroloquinoline quinone biosynthesis protein D